jgi:hypothetical protein
MADTSNNPVSGAAPSNPRYPNLSIQELEIIEYFVLGQKHSIASKNLKLEYTETSIRLSDSNGKLLGIGKQTNEWQRKILITNSSTYRNSILQSLTAQGFITKHKSSHPDFSEHHYYKVIDGYKLNYTEIIQLWKVWWNSKRFQLNVTNLPIDISVYIKGNWYPIRDLQPKQGNFVIQTTRGETIVAPEDYVVWIDKVKFEPVGDPNSLTGEPISISGRRSLGQAIPSGRVSPNINLPAPEEDLDLESYLNTFNTEDTGDIDRIEGIYNIDELLSGVIHEQAQISQPFPKSGDSAQATEPVSIDNNIDRVEPLSAQQSPSRVPTIDPPVDKSSPVANPPQPQSLKLKSIATLAKYLQEGDLTTHTEVLKNAQGQEINRKVTTTQRGCPQWAIEQIKQLR